MPAISRTTPGVYIEEIRKFPPSIAPVATAVPAFIGFTERNLMTKPGIKPRITSLLEFEQNFGTVSKVTGSVTVDSDNRVTIDSTTIPDYNLYYHMAMYFANGGGPCYVISIGNLSTSPTKDLFSDGLKALESFDEPTLIVMPEAVQLKSADYFSVVDEALRQCNKLQDRFTIIDVPAPSADQDFDASIAAFRDGMPIDVNFTKYGAAYSPHLRTVLNYMLDEEQITVTDNAAAGPGGGDTGDTGDTGGGAAGGGGSLASLKGTNTGAYNAVLAAFNEMRVELSPSSAVAGQYATVDRTRGVWKAPANVSLSSVIDPVVNINAETQGRMNVDTISGKSVNAIRSFMGKGTLIWGARTLAGNDNEWRYVPVRRFFNFVEESVKKATEGFVFEPNDRNTWVKVKAMIENFLINQWRAGALAGSTPEAAFFVKIGLGETMTAQDILEGYMIIEIGMAAVRPAEFIILRFSHKMQEA